MFFNFLLSSISNPSIEASFQLIYQNNLALVKDSLKVPRDLPKFQFQLKDVKDPGNLKGFFSKTNVFILWLISTYEVYAGKTLLDFVICLVIFKNNSLKGKQ